MASYKSFNFSFMLSGVKFMRVLHFTQFQEAHPDCSGSTVIYMFVCTGHLVKISHCESQSKQTGKH